MTSDRPTPAPISLAQMAEAVQWAADGIAQTPSSMIALVAAAALIRQVETGELVRPERAIAAYFDEPWRDI